MNKAQLVDRIAEVSGVTKVNAKKSIDALTMIAAETLQKGEKITLIGLGTFSVSVTKERTGRNPRNGAPIRIAPKRVVKFKAGSELSGVIK